MVANRLDVNAGCALAGTMIAPFKLPASMSALPPKADIGPNLSIDHLIGAAK
jgi:hypothetical protein